MKKYAARSMPISMAVVMEMKMVTKKVTIMTVLSDFCPFNTDFMAGMPLMFQLTTTRIAERVAMGMYRANLPRNSMIIKRTKALMMPATGVFPPFLMLVAVRATAAVAGIPPNRGLTILARPCAMSSELELCLKPVMPSATTALRSDSMAMSTASEKAGVRRSPSIGSVTAGNTGAWKEVGMEPKREPMVATGIPKNATTSVTARIATRAAGIFLFMRGHSRMMASDRRETRNETGLKVCR